MCGAVQGLGILKCTEKWKSLLALTVKCQGNDYDTLKQQK
jgi:hypothetical protein